MTAQVLVSAQLEILERDLSTVLRMLNERAELCREFGERRAAKGEAAAGAAWQRASEEALDREDAIRRMTEAKWIRPEALAAE